MGWFQKRISRRRRYEDLSVSIQEHLADKIDELMEKGMSKDEAARIARRDFGNVTLIEEQSREAWQWPMLESFISDVKYGMRQLRKSPAFAVTVTLTMALGIGANTAIFTLIHSVLMKSLPVTDPKSLVRIGDKVKGSLAIEVQNPDGAFNILSNDLYRYIRESTPEFEQLAAIEVGPDPVSVRFGSHPAQTEPIEFVSGNYFTTLGVGAFMGRAFTDADDKPGAAPVMVMSYQAWQSDYASDPSVIGSTFYLQSKPVTLIGIGPRGFYGDRVQSDAPTFFVPLSAEPLLRQASSILHQSDANWLYALGRLRPGTAVGPVEQKISANLRRWIVTQDAYAKYGIAPIVAKLHVVITPAGGGIQELQDTVRQELYLLFGISGFVLLVACANVANLLLARGAKRKAEISMRIALGAARLRVMRQMLTESVLLASLGGLAGLALAQLGTRAVLALAFPASPHIAIEVSPSLTVLGFAFLLSLATGVVFGMAPAWIASSDDPVNALKGGSRSVGERASFAQRSLIVLQAALSLVLLVGAGLLTRTLRNLEHQDFGVQTANRYVLHINPQDAGYLPGQLDTLHRDLERQFASIPGMRSVGLALFSPLDGNAWTFFVLIPGASTPALSKAPQALIDRVSPGFFETMGHSAIRGRLFTESDTDTAPKVAVVNQSFATKFFPGEDPIGRRFGSNGPEDAGAYEIVGVVPDAKYITPRANAAPLFFRPLAQWQRNLTDPTGINIEGQTHYISAIVMNFAGPPQNLDALVRRALGTVDPNLAIVDLRPLDFQFSTNFTQERLIARLTALFGSLSLLLAAIGLYGITAYRVTQRTREIGVRMAFGANRGRVAIMVMRGALSEAGLGLVLGIPIALIGARFLADQLFEVKPYDLLSLFGAAGVLAAAALIAGFIPARRAASIQPMHALRSE